jgi:hypothetical protein
VTQEVTTTIFIEKDYDELKNLGVEQKEIEGAEATYFERQQ